MSLDHRPGSAITFVSVPLAFIRFKALIEQVLGREVDLISYGGLKPKLDDDIRRDAVLL